MSLYCRVFGHSLYKVYDKEPVSLFEGDPNPDYSGEYVIRMKKTYLGCICRRCGFSVSRSAIESEFSNPLPPIEAEEPEYR